MSHEFSGEVLQQHGAFVRELTRALTRESEAEDVAQDTWLRWFRRPPASGARPRGWLTLVARGLAKNRQRGEERRTRVEAHVAPGERVDESPLDLCQQAEQLEGVIRAVRSLEAPYRDVILARYFRGLSVRALAAESGTNEETLRTRERRALEQLRAKLDREFGGRAAWAGVLGAFAPEATVALAPWAALAAAGVLAVGGGTALWWSGTHSATAAPALVALVEPAAPAAGPSVTPVTTPTRQPVLTTPSARSTGSSGSSSALVTGNGAVLLGTFLLADGTPAANAAWTLHGWPSNEELVVRYGLPDDWTDPSGTTDANGLFSLTLDPPRAFQFTLDVKATEHAEASWRWGELEPGRTLDLGTLTLARAATIQGRLVDGDGAPILGETWRVYAESQGLRSSAGRDECRVSAELDPVTGAFTLEGVQPGRNALQAYSKMANWLRGTEVVALAGQTVSGDLVYRGPRNAQRITVTTFCNPQYPDSEPAAEHIRLRADDGSERTAREIAGSSQSFSFDGLASGLYQIEIDDPRFRPWSQAGVAPGTALSPKLEPCATLLLDLRDAQGAALAPDQITVEEVGARYFPAETIVYRGSSPFSGRIALFPGDHLVRVQAGTRRETLRVDGIALGETRSVVHAFGDGSVLAGRLARAGGPAVPDHEVLLLAPAQVNDSNASPILGPGSFASNAEEYRKELAATRTASDGAFRFDLPGPGAYLVQARTAGGAAGFSSLVTLAAGESATDVELALPAGASVSGHVTAPGGSAAGLRLWIGTQSEGFEWSQACDSAVAIAGDGSYALADLAAGVAKVRVLLPADESFAGGGHVRSNGFSTWLELGALTLTEGASLVQDYTLPASPGQLTLDVTLNGAPAAGLAFLAEQAVGSDRQGLELEGESGPGGVCGPMLAFAGPWSLTIRSQEAGWLFDSDVTALVTAGGTTRVAVDVTTVSGRLRFLDASGQPLVNRDVFLSPERPDRPDMAVYPRGFRTDALGRAELALTTGQYRFTLDTSTPGAVLQWTATGPANADLEL